MIGVERGEGVATVPLALLVIMHVHIGWALLRCMGTS